ncbi:MAG: 6-phosphogluconolactonase [Candidatus Parcubacteria bacterium]|nr:6-phosphogluconolactonase [Candidatus Paceibacterota bacterium]
MQINLYKPKVMEFETLDVMYRQVCDIIEDKIHYTQQDKGVARLLLSADNPCLPIYKKLAHSGIIDWQDIELYQTDEKYVPKTDPNSKQKIISDALGVINQTAGSYFFDTSLEINTAIKNYNQILDTLDGVFFDQGIISVRSDGSIGGLFPGGNSIKHHDNYAIATQSPDSASGPNRLSLTVETILNTEELYIILTGESNRQVLLEMIEGNLPATEYPARVLLTHPNVTIFCCFD